MVSILLNSIPLQFPNAVLLTLPLCGHTHLPPAAPGSGLLNKNLQSKQSDPCRHCLSNFRERQFDSFSREDVCRNPRAFLNPPDWSGRLYCVEFRQRAFSTTFLRIFPSLVFSDENNSVNKTCVNCE